MIGNDMVRISRFISMTPILFSFILLPLSHKKKPPGKWLFQTVFRKWGFLPFIRES